MSNDTQRIEDESLHVQKAEWVTGQLERQRQMEDEILQRITREQEILDEKYRDIRENFEKSRQFQRFNEHCNEDIEEQVYALHGITPDKLQGMREYKSAFYLGSAFITFMISVLLVALSGYLHGMNSKICMIMLAGVGVEGALLSQRNVRSKLIDWLCSVMYFVVFIGMAAVFLTFELGYKEFDIISVVFSFAGTIFAVIGVSGYFIYNPYGDDKKFVRAARNDLRDINQTAKKQVIRNRKLRAKEEVRLAREAKQDELRALKEQEKEEKLRIREEKKRIREEEKAARKEAKSAEIGRAHV